MLEGILEGIIKFFLGLVMGLLQWVGSIILAILLAGFDNVALNHILTFIKIMGVAVVGVAILSAIIKVVIKIGDGERVSIGMNLRAWAMSILLAFSGVDVAKAIYLFLVDIGIKILPLINFNNFQQDGVSQEVQVLLIRFPQLSIKEAETLANLTPPDTLSFFIGLILSIILFFKVFQVFFMSLERIGHWIIVVLTMYPYLVMYIMGNDQALWQWIKQIVASGLSQSIMLIGLVVIIGAATNIGTSMYLAIGIAFGLQKIDQYMGAFSASAGGGLRTMTSSIGSSVTQGGLKKLGGLFKH